MNPAGRDPALGERAFYLDEHLPRSLMEEMRERGLNAHLVIDLGLEGTSDVTLLSELSRRDSSNLGWVLITCDSIMPVHFQRADDRGVGMSTGAVAVMEGLDSEKAWVKQRRILRWFTEVTYQPPGSAWRYYTGQYNPVLWLTH